MIQYILSIVLSEIDKSSEEQAWGIKGPYFVSIFSPDAAGMTFALAAREAVRKRGLLPPKERLVSVVRKRVAVILSRHRRE